MKYDRMDQVNNLIQQQLNNTINRDIELTPSILVTVTRVKTSRDLHYATVWVSVWPYNQSANTVAKLTRESKRLQQILGEQITLKFTPKLEFRTDNTEENADELEKKIFVN